MDGGAAAHDPAAWLRQRGQAWIDQRTGESTAARDALRALEGHSLAIRLAGPEVEILLAVVDGRLEWLEAGARPADATLVATPLDALALARSRSLTGLKQTDARLDGNIRVAETFAAALALLAPDPEAELAGWIGDMAAHEVAAAARALCGFVRRTAASLEQDTAEFLHEEQPMLARHYEVDEFVEAVDDLRDAVDRAASRLGRLEQRRRGRPPRALD